MFGWIIDLANFITRLIILGWQYFDHNVVRLRRGIVYTLQEFLTWLIRLVIFMIVVFVLFLNIMGVVITVLFLLLCMCCPLVILICIALLILV